MRQNEAGRRKVEAPASECQTSGLRDEHVESCHPFQLPRSIPAERSHPHDELWRPEAGPVFLRREATCVEPTKLSGAPFMVNIYPFITRKDHRGDVSLEYCLFTANRVVVQDGRYGYTNIFDAMIDALHVALDKIGYGDLEIVIGECGWPTQGDQDATTANAQIFNQNLINHCQSGAGTPRNPDKPIRCFVFEMYHENQKDTGPGPFEHFWGVNNSSGQPKYQLTW
jgi:Glycosyl hydrolases family 17